MKFRDNRLNIFINEDLTRVDGQILRKALKAKKDGGYHSVWTSYGKVFARKTQRDPVVCLSDKNDYLPTDTADD